MTTTEKQLAPIIFQYRCKICQWAQQNQDLFKDLHTQVLDVGSSYNRAMHYINARIEDEKIPVDKINNQNMSSHFSNHISLPDRVHVGINKTFGNAALKDVNPDMGQFVEDIVRRKVGNDVNDYLNLDQLRNQIMEKLELLDGIIERKSEDGKTSLVDLDALGAYTSLVKEIRSCILDLHKIRSSKQLINVAIKSLIEKYTFEVARQMTREYDVTHEDMLKAGLEPSAALKLTQGLKLQAARIIAETARSAIEDVIRSYKLG